MSSRPSIARDLGREARVRGLIPQLRPLHDRLREASYYLSDELTRQVLATVSEAEA